jgi:hypothetical protein
MKATTTGKIRVIISIVVTVIFALSAATVLVSCSLDGGASDIIPPSFAGVNTITRVGDTGLTLTWSAATDDDTTQGKVVYDIEENPGALYDGIYAMSMESQYIYVLGHDQLLGSKNARRRIEQRRKVTGTQ